MHPRLRAARQRTRVQHVQLACQQLPIPPELQQDRGFLHAQNLIGIQRESYEKFLQLGVSAEERADFGLQGVFKSVFPIQDFGNRASLQFVSYTLDEPSTTSRSVASAA